MSELPRDLPVAASPLANAPFDLDAVAAVLERFIAGEKEKALRAALTAYPPLLDGYAITLKFDNELLLAKVKGTHPALLARFKQELGNDHVTLQFVIYDEQQDPSPVKRLYTAREKFDHFVALNPAVQDLSDCFGLEIL
ncbi:MAG: hypothetical protein LBD64_04115 [Odoribacteraceae bacterium]|nr:hypothetical protein [Odoribacteraceae bacterium]